MPQVLGGKSTHKPAPLAGPATFISGIWRQGRCAWSFLRSIPLLWYGFAMAGASLLPVIFGLLAPTPVRYLGIGAMAFGVAAAAKDEDQRKVGLLCFMMGVLALLAWAVVGTAHRKLLGPANIQD